MNHAVLLEQRPNLEVREERASALHDRDNCDAEYPAIESASGRVLVAPPLKHAPENYREQQHPDDRYQDDDRPHRMPRSGAASAAVMADQTAWIARLRGREGTLPRGHVHAAICRR